MSPSMWFWRVILPGIGLIGCSIILLAPAWLDGPKPSPENRPIVSKNRVVAEGRIVARPGAEITVGTDLGGTVQAVPVAEKARVKKGDLLVEFRSDDLRLAVAEAEAKLAETDADLAFSQAEHQRKIQPRPKNEPAATPSETDSSRHEVQVAVARRKGAEVALTRAKAALGRAKVTAPIDGVVMTVHLQTGEIAAPAARLVTICDLSRLRIEAEVDEFDVARIATGDDVIIKAEGSPETWRGTVEEIPDRVATRSLIPDDPGRPSDTRVLRVKVGLTRSLPLKLGQQVELEIHPRGVPEMTRIR